MSKRKLKQSKILMEDWDKMKDDEEKKMEEYKNTDIVKVVDGRFVSTVNFQTYLKPIYGKCNMCPAAEANGGDCEAYKKDAECSIEKDVFTLIMRNFAEDGITDRDRFTVYPYIQMIFKMMRLEILENNMDDRRFFSRDFDEKMAYVKDKKLITNLSTDVVKVYLKLAKELKSTKKEREMNTRKFQGGEASKTFDVLIEED